MLYCICGYSYRTSWTRKTTAETNARGCRITIFILLLSKEMELDELYGREVNWNFFLLKMEKWNSITGKWWAIQLGKMCGLCRAPQMEKIQPSSRVIIYIFQLKLRPRNEQYETDINGIVERRSKWDNPPHDVCLFHLRRLLFVFLVKMGRLVSFAWRCPSVPDSFSLRHSTVELQTDKCRFWYSNGDKRKTSRHHEADAPTESARFSWRRQ